MLELLDIGGALMPSLLRGCDRMFGAHDHGMISPLSVPQRVLRAALQVSCQMRKSFHHNAITLMALCLMSDIVEDPTTNAAVTAL
ncbi:hypothetical protein NKL07_32515 [Mesorhizobium sp. C280B]|uniref:hypothetical protein n=1 Tax=unclassified Mesorhizobium TaxID=325217 RepID=UPI000411203E|nr:hypothetical protein [Mesorhizobium sp. LSJC280B00]